MYLPQRLQTVSSASPLNAGIRLLPYTFGAALGAVLANVVGSKRRLAVVYILSFGALLQLTGLVLLSTLPTTRDFPARGYGFETLAGFGVGVTFGILVLVTPFVANPEDLGECPYNNRITNPLCSLLLACTDSISAVATGAIIQFRFLGGVIGLSIASSVMNSYLKTHLTTVLSSKTLATLLQTPEVLGTFAPDVQAQVLEIFAQNYNLQYKLMIGFAAAQFPATAIMWKQGEQIKAG